MDITDLLVYRKSLQNLRKIYSLVNKISNSFNAEKFQVIKSAGAVPALISEAFSRRRLQRDSRRFFELTMVESDEVITHLRKIALAIPELLDECKVIATDYKITSKQLNKMCHIWKGSLKKDK